MILSQGFHWRSQRALGFLSLFGGAVNLIFWILYFAGDLDFGIGNECMVQRFESAFPFADGLLAVLLLIAGVGLMRKKPFGTYSLAAGSSISVYLGILDITFYVNGGLYTPWTVSSVFEAFINIFCVGGGLLASFFAWRFWRLPC